MSRAAFFDLDGTLLRKPSSEIRFLLFLWRRNYIGLRQILAGLTYYPLWILRHGREVGRKNKAFLAGLSHTELQDLANQWVQQNLALLLDPIIVAQVEYCREAGYRLVLMTGSPDFLAKPIAQRLGIEDCISTLCHLKGDRLTAFPPTQHPFSREKVELAAAWCAEHSVDLKDCTAYGDSRQDYHLLNAVGKPVAVNPDRRMFRMAARRNWQVLDTT